MFNSHVLSTNPLHESSLKALRTWRSRCGTEDSTNLSTRLLDTSSLPDSKALAGVSGREASWGGFFQESVCKLVEIRPGDTGRYVTLSYCWGAALPYKTTTHNIDKHRAGLAFSVLRRTLQDAIMIARFVDFRYIWIDCLAIVQNDPEDWSREAASMAKIYSNATLCIAASRAVYCGAGFLHPRKRIKWHHAQVQDAHRAFDLYLASKSRSPTDDEFSWNWDPCVSFLKVANRTRKEVSANLL